MANRVSFNPRTSTFRSFKKKIETYFKKNEIKYIIKKEVLMVLGIDHKNWKRDLEAKDCKESDKKLAYVQNLFTKGEVDLLHELLATHQGRLEYWKTAYANDYNKADDNIPPININFNKQETRVIELTPEKIEVNK